MPTNQTIALLTGNASRARGFLNSARNIYKAINKRKYNVEVIGIARTGAWRHLPVDVFQKAESIEGKKARRSY
ncbi:MAG: hypothetical protein R2788_01805 [Saprospiraceae bacterium]